MPLAFGGLEGAGVDHVDLGVQQVLEGGQEPANAIAVALLAAAAARMASRWAPRIRSRRVMGPEYPARAPQGHQRPVWRGETPMPGVVAAGGLRRVGGEAAARIAPAGAGRADWSDHRSDVRIRRRV